MCKEISATPWSIDWHKTRKQWSPRRHSQEKVDLQTSSLQCSSIARVLGLFSSQTSSIARVYGSLMAKLIYKGFSGSGFSHCKAQCKGLRYRGFSSFQRALEFSHCKAQCKGWRYRAFSSFQRVLEFLDCLFILVMKFSHVKAHL